MSLTIPTLLQGEMFFDYTTNQLWTGTKSNGNHQIPVSTINGVMLPDSTVLQTALGLQRGILTGVAAITGSSVAVVFASAYVGASQPIVVVTPYTQAPLHWVTFQGSANNWTGFTINTASSYFGAFNYLVVGNPN